MGWTTAYKNSLLDGNPLEPNLVALHNDDPGDPDSGDPANEISGGGYSREAVTLAAAANAARAFNAEVPFSGPALEPVTHISLWNSTGPTFLGSFARSSGDAAFNAAGEYTLSTATKITLSDPA